MLTRNGVNKDPLVQGFQTQRIRTGWKRNELGQFDNEMEWLSEMVQILQWLENFIKTAEELCKRILKKDEDKKVRGLSLTEEQEERSKIVEERKKNQMKEREKLRI